MADKVISDDQTETRESKGYEHVNKNYDDCENEEGGSWDSYSVSDSESETEEESETE
jgi:hypothetical protein